MNNQDLAESFMLTRLIQERKLAIESNQQSNREKLLRPRVVFDVDDVLCVNLGDFSRIEEDLCKKYPNSPIIPFKHLGTEYPHFFYADYGEAFLTFLIWGWSIDFFSSGQGMRNLNVVPPFVARVLAPYSRDIKKDYSDLIDLGDFRIFSRHHMVDGETVKCTKDGGRRPYHIFGNYKKDLSVMMINLEGSLDTFIDNVILIDDDRTFVVGGQQYPFIQMDCSASSDFKYFLNVGDFKKKDFQKDNNPMNNSAYILGVLKECKTKMDEEGISLRKALDDVLRRPNHIPDRFNNPTPWFLRFDVINNPKAKEWIEQGRELIQQVRQQGHSSPLSSSEFYKALEDRLCGDKINLKEAIKESEMRNKVPDGWYKDGRSFTVALDILIGGEL